MPFNYRNKLQYNPLNPNIIAGASKSPFSVAGQEMNNLADAIDNRVFNRDVQGVTSLDDLARMRVPQTPEAMAQFKQKQGALSAIGAEEQRNRLFDIQKAQEARAIDKFGREKQLFDLGIQDREQAPQILGGIASGVETPEGKRPFNLQELKDAQLIYPENKTVFDALQKQIEPLEKALAPTTQKGSRVYKTLRGNLERQAQVENWDEKTYNERLTKLNSDFETKALQGQGEVADIDSRVLQAKILEDGYSFDSYDKGNAIATESAVKTDKNIYTTNLKKSEADYKQQANFTKQMIDVNNDFNKAVGKDGFKSGTWDSVVQWMDTITAETFTSKDMEKVLTQAGLNTKLGRVLAERLKFYSGTAVADAEFERTKELMIGLGSQDERIRQRALNTFVEEEVTALEYTGELLGGSGLGQTAKSKYDYATKSYGKEPTAVGIDASTTVPTGMKKQYNSDTGEYRFVKIGG